jgi:hypothetical protein
MGLRLQPQLLLFRQSMEARVRFHLAEWGLESLYTPLYVSGEGS